jgi:hypothetical protein
MKKNTKVWLGLLAVTTLALSLMPGRASAQVLLGGRGCTLEACVEQAQNEYACCSGKADVCIKQLAAEPAPGKRTCAQELVADIAECPGEVLTCELEELGGRGGMQPPPIKEAQ